MSKFAEWLSDIKSGTAESATDGGFQVDRARLDLLFSKEKQEEMILEGVLVIDDAKQT